MSISKAQAQALADGFLDDIGSNKDGLQPRETFSEMILIAGEFIEDCQQNLLSSNSNASGELSASLIANEPEKVGNAMRIDVYMNFYGAFVNSGVKGTKSGSSTAGYSFKYDMPTKNMVKAIQQWIDRGKISTSSVKKYSGYGRHEIKNKSIAQLDMAFAVARSIKQHGLKPTGFLDKAVAASVSKVADRLGVALSIDVLNSIR